jgi:hypothetical protein
MSRNILMILKSLVFFFNFDNYFRNFYKSNIPNCSIGGGKGSFKAVIAFT